MPATGVPVSAEMNVRVEPDDSRPAGESVTSPAGSGLVGDEPWQAVIRSAAAKHVTLEAPRRIVSIAVLLHMSDLSTRVVPISPRARDADYGELQVPANTALTTATTTTFCEESHPGTKSDVSRQRVYVPRVTSRFVDLATVWRKTRPARVTLGPAFCTRR
jgi:hypothetical protein